MAIARKVSLYGQSIFSNDVKRVSKFRSEESRGNDAQLTIVLHVLFVS